MIICSFNDYTNMKYDTVQSVKQFCSIRRESKIKDRKDLWLSYDSVDYFRTTVMFSMVYTIVNFL